MTDVLIRGAIESDFDDILRLNTGAVQHTSPLDIERLRHLHELSSYHVVVEAESSIAGFLLAMREGCLYGNANYAWFSARFPIFLYVDRVVIAERFRGLGLGSRLYEQFFNFARSNSVPTITCEYNIVPPNEGSAIFHRRFEFQELGTQWLNQRTKKVSMQAAASGLFAAADKKTIK